MEPSPAEYKKRICHKQKMSPRSNKCLILFFFVFAFPFSLVFFLLFSFFTSFVFRMFCSCFLLLFSFGEIDTSCDSSFLECMFIVSFFCFLVSCFLFLSLFLFFFARFPLLLPSHVFFLSFGEVALSGLLLLEVSKKRFFTTMRIPNQTVGPFCSPVFALRSSLFHVLHSSMFHLFMIRKFYFPFFTIVFFFICTMFFTFHI